jgi:hypothetical protein
MTSLNFLNQSCRGDFNRPGRMNSPLHQQKLFWENKLIAAQNHLCNCFNPQKFSRRPVVLEIFRNLN